MNNFKKGDVVLIETDIKMHYIFDHIENDKLIVQLPGVRTGDFELVCDEIKIKDIKNIKLHYESEFDTILEISKNDELKIRFIDSTKRYRVNEINNRELILSDLDQVISINIDDLDNIIFDEGKFECECNKSESEIEIIDK